MTEIKLNVDDRYLPAFLAFMETLAYVEVEKVKRTKRGAKTAVAAQALRDSLPPGSPLREAIKPIRTNVTAEDLIRESGNLKTDLEQLKKLALELDIPQSADELIEQLTP